MALTTRDPQAALPVIEVQPGSVQWPCAHPMPDVPDRVAEIAQALRRHRAPAVLAHVTGHAAGRNGLPTGRAAPVPAPDAQAGSVARSFPRLGESSRVANVGRLLARA